MAILIALFIALAFVAGLIVMRAWVLTILWGWFIVPFGLPALGIAWAIGIAATISIFTAKPVKSEEGDNSSLAFAIVQPLMALLIGFVAHSFLV